MTAKVNLIWYFDTYIRIKYHLHERIKRYTNFMDALCYFLQFQRSFFVWNMAYLPAKMLSARLEKGIQQTIRKIKDKFQNYNCMIVIKFCPTILITAFLPYKQTFHNLNRSSAVVYLLLSQFGNLLYHNVYPFYLDVHPLK